MTTFVFDLDGVLYLGETSVPGADETLAELAVGGAQLLFATNNSYRTRDDVVAKIRRRTGYRVTAGQVFTSAMSAAAVARSLEVRRPLVLGGPGIHEAVTDGGGAVVVDPDVADGVIVGLDYGFTYETLEMAMTVARSGRPFIATNRDSSFPVDGHLRPGAGSVVAAVAEASGVAPINAGKPERPMIELLLGAITSDLVVMVGDRPETDLAMGKRAGWATVGVSTGVVARRDEIPRDWNPDLFLDSVAQLPGAAWERGWLPLEAKRETQAIEPVDERAPK